MTHLSDKVGKTTYAPLRRADAEPGALIGRRGHLYEILPPDTEGSSAHFLRIRDEVDGVVGVLLPAAYRYYRLVRRAPCCPDTLEGLA